MDWTIAIERNREALKRVLAALVAMVGLGNGQSAVANRQSGSELAQAVDGPTDGLLPTADCRLTLPRHLHRAVLRLLRPAESAARRLVIVAARDVVVELPPARPRKPKPRPTILRGRIGTGIVMPRHIFAPPPLTPPHKGEGVVYAAPGLAANVVGANASESPSPLWGSEGRARQAARPGKVRGGGKGSPARTLGFQLFDPMRRPPRLRASATGIPRISIPGLSEPVPLRRPPSPHDRIDAGRLVLRLAALSRALDDLPREARRFARWRARRAQISAPSLPSMGKVPRDARGCKNVRRVWPLRFGRPPGHRPAGSRRPREEVHDILDATHGLAFDILERPDTS